jgi:hypothetical protein
MVVAVSAVVKGIEAGAFVPWASTPGARLTSPTAAKPSVHLFIFINQVPPTFLFLLIRFYAFNWGKKQFTRPHQNGALGRTIGNSTGIDNKFFRYFFYFFEETL